jgi:hypothetical protein
VQEELEGIMISILDGYEERVEDMRRKKVGVDQYGQQMRDLERSNNN